MTTISVSPYLEKQLFTIRTPSTNLHDFRKAIKKIGTFMAAKVCEDLPYRMVTVKTVLGSFANHIIVSDNIVVVTILRGGLPMMDGVLKVFPEAEVGFIAMKRNEATLQPTVFYQGMPSLKDKIVILTDPMLATGGSMIAGIKIIEALNPEAIIGMTIIASEEGIKRVSAHGSSILMYMAVIDPILNKIGYIVPGLGDAGDRAYGVKVD